MNGVRRAQLQHSINFWGERKTREMSAGVDVAGFCRREIIKGPLASSRSLEMDALRSFESVAK